MDSFLHNRDLRHERVKPINNFLIPYLTTEHKLNGTISDSESQVRANVFKFELNVFCHG